MSRDQKPRLGRGLASLIRRSDEKPPAAGQYQPADPADAAPAAVQLDSASGHPQPMDTAKPHQPLSLPISSIRRNPYQPRRTFDEDALKGLADSIRAHGLLQPIVVVEAGIVEGQACYELIAGERRFRASQIAGVTDIPAIIRRSTPQQMLELALVENIHRSDLSPMERATAYRELMDRFRLTQQQVAEAIGEPRATIANHVRMLELPDDVQKLVGEGALSFGHAKVLAGAAGRGELQSSLAAKAAKAGSSVRELETMLAEANAAAGISVVKHPSAKRAKSPYLADVERQISEAVGTKVTILAGRKKHRGKLVVEYYTLDDFDRIVSAFGVKLES